MQVEHVSVERFVSGPALPLIFRFMQHQYPAIASSSQEQAVRKRISETSADMQGKAICQEAQKDKSGLAAKSLYILVEMFGAEAGNMALKTFSFGACYLAGSVAPKNLWAFQEQNRFMEAFLGKGRMRDNNIMDRFPVRVINAGVSTTKQVVK